MEKIRISVVIPLYKGGNYAKIALESVLAQSYQNFEIIVVDNNASDESRHAVFPLIKKFPDKIRLFHENIQGVCSARNRGITESNGELVALLDDDDVMYSDRLQKQVDLFDLYPESSIISCWDDLISPEGEMISKNNTPGEFFPAKLLFENTDRYKKTPFMHFLPSSMLFSRKTAISVGLFDLRFNPCGNEDFDFLFRMYEFGPFRIVPQSGIQYRYTDNKFESKKWNYNGARNLALWEKTNLLFEVIQSYKFKDRPRISKRELRIIQAQWTRELGCFLMRYPNKRIQAKKLLKRSLSYDKKKYKSIKYLIRYFYPKFLIANAFNFEKDEEFPNNFIFPENFEKNWFATSEK